MTSLHGLPDYEAQRALYDPNIFDAMPAQQWPQQWHATDRFPTPQSVGDNEFHQERSRQISFYPEPSYYRLGDPDLPVAPYRDAFLSTVAEHQNIVVSSDTGSGKSSQLGLYLLEAGYPRVFVTQPRIIAARNLFQWAQQGLGPEHAHLAGYLTGNAADSDCSEEARLIYITEHLLFKMVNRGQLRPDDVVINDEAHERTGPTVALLGRLKEILPERPEMRLIISSATINTDEFATYLKSPEGEPAPVLILPGRTFPIKDVATDQTVAAVMRQQMREGKNVLAFEPGIGRLRTTVAKAQSRNSRETVHPLYGDQSPSQQARALTPDDHNHVVSSRIGETSLTPVNKQVVVDGGLSNFGEYEAGVRKLRTGVSSQATMRQRRGRVGRKEEGLYFIAVPTDAPPPPPFEERPEFDPPSIENSSVASFLAELLSQGRDINDLDLIESPTHENLAYDRKLLMRLGATAIEDGRAVLTDIGLAMIDLPLDPPLARMLVEARKEVDDPEIDIEALRLQVAAVAAIQQVNGILDNRQGSAQRYLRRKTHQEVMSNETTSDVLFALDVFAAMLVKRRQLLGSDTEDAAEKFERLLEQSDVLPNRFLKALRGFEELCNREGLDMDMLVKPSQPHRRQIVACQIAGAEELFVQRSKQVHVDIRGEHRTLGRRTTVGSHAAQLVIGTAFDFIGLSERGAFRRKFISGGSVVDVGQLLQHAGHRITQKALGFGVNRRGNLIERQALYFDGEMHFAEEERALPPTAETRTALITAMMTGRAPSVDERKGIVGFRPASTPRAGQAVGRWKQALELEQASRVKLNIEKGYAKLIRKVIRQSLETVPLEVTDPEELDRLIPQVYLNSIVRPTRKKDLPDIVVRNPDSLIVPIDEETRLRIPVGYKNEIAYVTLPRELWSTIRREHFEPVEVEHHIKVRLANGKYQTIDAAFKLLDERREAEAAKKTRRLERQESALRRDPSVPTRKERRNNIEDEIEVQLKAQARALLSKRGLKGLPNSIRKQQLRQKTEKLRSKQAALQSA